MSVSIRLPLALLAASITVATAAQSKPRGPQDPDYSAFSPITVEAFGEQVRASIPDARKLLDDALVDSTRARIRSAKGYYVLQGMTYSIANMRLEGGTPRAIICIELNAPNRMGGMTGWKTVAITPSTRSIENDDMGTKCPTATWTMPFVGPVEIVPAELLPAASGS